MLFVFFPPSKMNLYVAAVMSMYFLLLLLLMSLWCTAWFISFFHSPKSIIFAR